MQMNVLTLAQVPAVETLYEHVGPTTKLPGPLTMVADAVSEPASITPFTALAVMVRVGFVWTAFVAGAGVIEMKASSGARFALPVADPVTPVKLHVVAWFAGVQASSGALLQRVFPLRLQVPAVPFKPDELFMKNDCVMAACFTLIVAMNFFSSGPSVHPDSVSTTLSGAATAPAGTTG